jgi:two-component system NtrC family sensor kinase
MKKRSRAGGELIKGRRRKTPEPKRRNAPSAVPRSKSSKSSPPGEETEVARLTRERDEALEQQTATGDVLKIISRPSFDLQAVLATLVKLAARLCEADLVAIHRPRDGTMQLAANFGLSQEWEEIINRAPIVPGRGTATGRVLLTGRAVQIADVEADPEYTFTEGQRAGGFRTVLALPLEREGETIGVIVLCRTTVHPFTDKQISLVQNSAAQAVIAIENARLLNELRQRTTDLTERTADLTEALERQTATSEVLQVISSSPGYLEPVFQAMLENATRICEAKFGVVFSFDGNEFHFEAQVGTPPELAEYNRAGPMPQPLPGSHLDRLRQTKRVSYTADYAAEGIPAPPVTLGGARSTVDVPMLKDNELVGAFSIYRQEVRPFTDKQIDLVKNFAAQAVIAIENARLLNELRQRTTDLSEALEQQTATSEVLQVISSSPGDLEPVFAAILNNAVRICAALNATLWSFENGRFHFLARYSDMPGSVSDPSVSDPIQPGPNSGLGRVRSTKQIVHITDYAAEPAYLERDPFAVRVVEELGIRTNLSVPMLQDNELVGAFSIYRTTVKPFSEKQIELITGFAAQAVIAIENARLLNELRQRTAELTVALEQQTATADVLKVIRTYLKIPDCCRSAINEE